MAPYYKLLISQTPPVLPANTEILDKLQAANTAELAKLDLKLAEAEKTEGESEISDALRARAAYLTKIGDKV